MWDKLRCCCLLLATVFSCLLNHAHSQERDSPEFFQNLTCLTQNLETLLCSWDILGPTNSGTVYEVCYSSSKPQTCFETEERRLEIELEIFATLEIKITAKNVLGTPEKRFQKTMQDIPYIPYTPHILSLVADEMYTLYVEWSVDSSNFLNDVDIQWEVEILRSENMDIVSNVSLNTRWTQNETTFHWTWTSDFALTCTSYSVRIRCYVHEKYYYGAIRWSDWSAIKTVYGSSYSNVFPEDQVVAVGSNMTFCCVAPEGQRINMISYGYFYCPLIHLSRNSSAIKVTNMSMTLSSGTNVVCCAEGYEIITGTVIFVGYPPDTPQNLTCETHNLKEIVCSWSPGRSTGLYGERDTFYSLHERSSGINISCDNYEESTDQFYCIFATRQSQNLYNFTVEASNDLGKSEASLAINISESIHPKPPEKITILNVSPSEVVISWNLPGNFASVKLLCEVEIQNVHEKETEMRNVSLPGLDNSNYSVSLDKLHPFKDYNLRVRCAAFDHFWKWSEWSIGKRHFTLESAPSRKPDIWREVAQSSEGQTITVYWKMLSINDANGRILSYKVSWRPLKSDLEPEYTILLAPLNKTAITLDNNDERDYEISVVANNSAGSSPPAKITTVQLPNDVELERAVGAADGINITWQLDANISCGHVVQWMPSSHPHSSKLRWKRFSSYKTSAFITSDHFLVGVRYTVSVYGCKDNKYQLLKKVIGYIEELSPRVAPNFTIEETTSNSIQVKWENIPEDDLQGFLRGYLVYVAKQENDTSSTNFMDLVGHAETKIKNITSPAVRILKIQDLQGGTSYHVGLQAYTGGGKGPIKSSNVITNDNSIALILAILIPIVVAVLLGIVTSTICYQKREWIKETFYPDIPNPENSKALQFQKNVNEGNNAIKTLEMNPCTPNNVEVVETLSTVPKILDTELNSPVAEDLSDQLPVDDLDTEDENHVVVSYCPPIANEDVSSAALDESVASSQVVYIDIQSMHQPQANPEEEPENDFFDKAGYKPQMQLPLTTVKMDSQSPTEDNVAASAGYQPQVNPNSWNMDSPGSPTFMEGNSENENASFGSPCSINSRHFLIPPVDDKDSLKPTHIGWSLASLFQNKQDD